MCCRWRNATSSSDDHVSEWLTWQIVDSAFPTGMFVHSGGLESAWQHGEVPDADSLRLYVDAAILQAAYSVMPLLNAGFDSPHAVPRLDAIADAFLTNSVARANRAQGRTLLATVTRVWPGDALTAVTTLAAGTAAHVAPLSGAALRALGLQLPVVQRMVLYCAARGVLSAAIRLGIAGSYEAQRLQAECGAMLDHVAQRCAAFTLDDLAQTAPVIDLLQSRHDCLYSRLFQS